MATSLQAPESSHQRASADDERPDLTPGELLELLGDEYTRRVFEAVAAQSRAGREVAEVADVSRTTAYRRLNDLRDAGLVTTEMAVNKNGHHRERYEAVVNHVAVSVDEGSIETSVTFDR